MSENFPSVVEKHAPLKKKNVRGNQAPFVNREFRKAIYTRSRLRNKYWKNPTSENELRYKQQRNKCVSLRKKSMKLYLNKSAADGIVTNKSFWKFIKPFLKNKSCHAQNDMMLIKNGEIITEEKDLAATFNKHYINIVEKSSGIKPANVAMIRNICDNDTDTINVINEAYKNHPSIKKIKEITEKNTTKRSFKLDFSTKPYITTLQKNTDIKKATGIEKISRKLVKLSANILSEPPTNTINDSLNVGIFLDAAKTATVSPIDKGTDNKNSISNFRPVSELSVFSKIFEAFINS